MHGRAGHRPRPLLCKGMEELLQLWPLLDASQLADCQKVLQKLAIIDPYLLLTKLLQKAP